MGGPAYFITGKRNDLRLLTPETARHCDDCRLYTHRDQDVLDATEKVPQDYSRTQDGLHVVSEKFKAICEEVGVKAVRFSPLSNGSFLFKPEREVFLDISKALQRTKGVCTTCGRLRAFLGDISAVTLLSGQKRIGSTEIVQSAQGFGGVGFLCHDCIFGEEIMEALNDQGLQGGIHWNQVLSL